MYINLGAFLHYRADTIHIAEVQFRVDALTVHVHAHGHYIQIAGALTIAQHRAFHALCAGHHAQFGCGDTTAAVIMGVQTDNHGIAVFDMTAEPFNLVGIDIGGCHFNRGWQIQNHLALRAGLPDIGDRITDFDSKIEFGAGKAFR